MSEIEEMVLEESSSTEDKQDESNYTTYGSSSLLAPLLFYSVNFNTDTNTYSEKVVGKKYIDRFKGFLNEKNRVKNLDILQKISELEYNWDECGSDCFRPNLIKKVVRLIGNISIQPDIVPTGRNSIQFEYFFRDDEYLEFEIFEDRILALHMNGETVSFEGEVKEETLFEMIDRYVR